MLGKRHLAPLTLPWATMELKEYGRKRNFRRTPEPEGSQRVEPDQHFVVQKHQASHLHYDFRLQVAGVLKSWAIPKGPSIDPSCTRLAIRVEDHPIEYKDFEGVIHSGEYGGGTVMIWDCGLYELLEEKDPQRNIQEGGRRFRLHGKKLKGGFTLIKTEYQKNRNAWLLIKKNDTFARRDYEIVKEQVKSCKTGLTLEEIERPQFSFWKVSY